MKRIFSLLLLLALFAGLIPAAAAFSDITAPDELFAASALQAMGIMEGVGGGRFAPNEFLTRGQFAKLATLAKGFSEMKVYQSYTIFADVRNTTWYAPYVNAAVRKYKILQGYPDGTYRPDNKVTFGEAVTILVNLLGYTVADVGPFWPADYIAKADELGLTDGVSLQANDSIPRGKAAILLCNLLLSDTKDGTPFIRTAFSSVKENMILTATAGSDPSLSDGKASFADEGGDTQTLALARDIPVNLVGSKGYLVLDPASQNKAAGFLPDTRGVVSGTVVHSYAGRLELADGSYVIPRTARVCVGGKVENYADGWFNLLPGHTVNLFYGEGGEIELVSRAADMALGDTFIYGISSGAGIKSGAKIVKNGAETTPSALRKYDVVSYDSGKNTYYVSDRKIKGIYEAATPAYAYPTEITVLGNRFYISEKAASFFSSMRPGDVIALLLDANGNVAAAYPGSEISFEQLGLMTKYSAGECTIELLAGIAVSGKPELSGFPAFTSYKAGSVSSLALSEGRLVKVTQSSDTLVIRPVEYGDKRYGEWDIAGGKAGSVSVSSTVRIYEQVDKEAPLRPIRVSDIPLEKVPSGKIRHIVTGSSGAAELIVLGDVTGLNWEYGILASRSEEETVVVGDEDSGKGELTTTFYHYTLTQKDGEKSYSAALDGGSFHDVPAAVPKGLYELSYYKNVPARKLVKAATVKNEHFDGNKGIRAAGSYIPLPEDAETLPVYLSGAKRFITLGDARANFDTFAIYINQPVSEGGRCVLIVAS